MCVLRGLEAIGFDDHEAMVQQATEWLRMMQNPDGGWGETIGSYDDVNQKGVGLSTSFADRLGGARTDGGWGLSLANRWLAASLICWIISRPTVAGARCPTPARDFPASFI